MLPEEERLTLESKEVLESLEYLISSMDKLLIRIKKAVLAGDLNLENHIYDSSIWNNLGLFCLRNDLPRLAGKIYTSMLETIREYERTRKVEVYKGLALNNLGIALYSGGGYTDAKRALEKAAEEDRRVYHEQASVKGKAISALSGLFPVTS